MGKKKKICKGNRGFATTSVVSKTVELGIKTDREKSLEDVIVPVKNNPICTEAPICKAEPEIPKELLSVMETLKQYVSKPAPENSLFVDIENEAETNAIALLQELEFVTSLSHLISLIQKKDFMQIPAIPNAWMQLFDDIPSEMKLKQKILGTFLKLERLGFNAELIQYALLINGVEFKKNLSWLVLSVPEPDLPSLWQRQNTSKSSAVTVVKLSNTPLAPEVNKIPATEIGLPFIPDVPAKKSSMDEDLKRSILYLAEMQQDEPLHASDENSPDLQQDAVIEQTLQDDNTAKLLNASFSQSCIEAPLIGGPSSIVPAKKSSMDEDLKRSILYLAEMQQDEPVLATDEDGPDLQQAVVVEEVLQDDDIFGSFFEDAAEARDATSSICVVETRQKLDLKYARNSGNPPFKLLEQHIKSVSSKMIVEYKRVPTITAKMHAYTLILDTVYNMEAFMCETKEEAQNYLAVKALYAIASQYSYYLQMPIVFKHMWKEWAKRDEDEKKQNSEAENLRKISSVNYIFETCKSVCAENDQLTSSVTLESRMTASSGPVPSARSFNDLTSVHSILDSRKDNQRFLKFQQDRAQLPIMAIEEELMHCLEASNVVVVSGQTGSGKTTQGKFYCGRCLTRYLFRDSSSDDIGVSE